MQQNIHTACCTLYKNKRALSLSLFRGLFSVRSTCFFFSGSQLVCVASPGVGGSALVMHGCAHLFDMGDASPRLQDGWGEETATSALLEVTQLHLGSVAPTGRSVVQGAFEQGTETTVAPSGQHDCHCDPLLYLFTETLKYALRIEGDNALFTLSMYGRN